MNERNKAQRHRVNRRAFLYGAGGVALGLPFLEGLPQRSAWAQDAPPIFTFFMCAACGVEPKHFWPTEDGTLNLTTGKAVDALADHAENLLIVRNVDFPQTGPTGCGHAQGLAQALTARTPTGNGGSATGTGPSVDWVISKAVNPQGSDPMALYAGNLRNGYIADRLSFNDNGQVRASVDNPYKLYQTLTGLVPAGGGAPTTPEPTADPLAEELVVRRKSVNDLVRDQLSALQNSPKVSADDRQRLQQHFDSIRDIENTLVDMGTNMAALGCSMDGIETSAFDALSSWKYNPTNVATGGIENIVELHLQIVALAFACNHNRSGTLQWGDGTDHTIYQVPSNQSLGNWNFHYISHRTQSDGSLGQNNTAETAHAEIDDVRMQTLAKGLNHFKERGLQDQAMVVWTNHIAEGNHKMSNVPFIIWGNGGGAIKQNMLVDAKHQKNGALYNVVISAATGTPTTNFGSSGGEVMTAIQA